MNIRHRVCLKCNTPFTSKSPGNRICETCAKSNRKISFTPSSPKFASPAGKAPNE